MDVMDVQDYLWQLAQVNRHGFGFLLGYGLTWWAAAVIARRFGDRVGAYAVLFQGLVGLPLGLMLTAVAAVGPRPEDPTFNALSIYLSMGQLLVLPLAIVLIIREHYRLAVAVLAVVLAVHLIPYAWLYRSPVYLAVGIVIAVGSAVVIGRQTRTGLAIPLICAVTGSALLLGSVAAFVG